MTKQNLVLDTSLVMEFPQFIENNKKKYKFIIPAIVLEELDNLKDGRDYTRSYKARKALKAIHKNEDDIKFDPHNTFKVDVPKEIDWLDQSKPDNRIVACAMANDAILGTTDITPKIKCKALGIGCIDVEQSEPYKGYVEITLDENSEEDAELMRHIDESPEDNVFGLLNNQYAIITIKEDEDDLVALEAPKKQDQTFLRWNGHKYVPVRNIFPKKVIEHRNNLQYLALDLLSNKNIPIKIIAGNYGSGKTFLTTNAGLYFVNEKGKYDSLDLIRHNDLPGKDPGSLPGDLDEKTEVLFGSVAQYLPNGALGLQHMKENHLINTYISYFIKGMDISGFAIVDESQDMTLNDIKKLGTRINEKGCVCFLGDWKQKEGKYSNTSGFLTLIEELKGNPLVGIVVLDEDVRSRASKVFADL